MSYSLNIHQEPISSLYPVRPSHTSTTADTQPGSIPAPRIIIISAIIMGYDNMCLNQVAFLIEYNFVESKNSNYSLFYVPNTCPTRARLIVKYTLISFFGTGTWLNTWVFRNILKLKIQVLRGYTLSNLFQGIASTILKEMDSIGGLTALLPDLLWKCKVKVKKSRSVVSDSI